MTVKSSVSLTDEQDSFVRAMVADGRYPSASAVLQQGLELLRAKTEADALEIEALRTLLKMRRQGALRSSAAMKSRIEAIAAKKRREHGL